MNRIFGTTKSKEPKPTLTEAIASVKKSDARVVSVEDKIKRLDNELMKYRDQMGKMRDGPGKSAVKQRALRVLQQKKLYEGQRDQLYQQTFNLEQASMAQENLKNTMVMVDTLKTTNKVLKQEYGKVNVDQIEKIQDEMTDLLEQASDVQDIMSRAYGVPDDIDEDELQAELDALGDEMYDLGEDIPAYLSEPTGELPNVPSTMMGEDSSKIGGKEQTEESQKEASAQGLQ